MEEHPGTRSVVANVYPLFVAPSDPHLVPPVRRDGDGECHTGLDRNSDLRKLEAFVPCTASPLDRIGNTAGSATGDCHHITSNSVRRQVGKGRTGADCTCALECLSECGIHRGDVRALRWRSFDRRRPGDGGCRRARGDHDQTANRCGKCQRVRNPTMARPVHSVRLRSHGCTDTVPDYDSSICIAGIHSPEWRFCILQAEPSGQLRIVVHLSYEMSYICPMAVVNFRTDERSQRALDELTADGSTVSVAIRQALVDAARLRRREQMRNESAGLLDDAVDLAESRAVLKEMDDLRAR